MIFRLFWFWTYNIYILLKCQIFQKIWKREPKSNSLLRTMLEKLALLNMLDPLLEKKPKEIMLDWNLRSLMAKTMEPMQARNTSKRNSIMVCSWNQLQLHIWMELQLLEELRLLQRQKYQPHRHQINFLRI